MKRVIEIVTFGAAIILGVLIIMTVQSRLNRKANLQNSLDAAVKEAVDEVSMKGNADSTMTVDEMKAEFVGILCKDLDISYDTSDAGKSDSGKYYDKGMALQIDFTDASVTEGIMGVHATLKMTYPSGRETAVESTGVVLIEDEGDKEVCTITYLITPGMQERLKVPSPVKVYTRAKDYGAGVSLLPVPDIPGGSKWKVVNKGSGYDLEIGQVVSKVRLRKIPVGGDITFINTPDPDPDPEPKDVPYEVVYLKSVDPSAADVTGAIPFDPGNPDFVGKLAPGTIISHGDRYYEVDEADPGTGKINDVISPAPKDIGGYVTPAPKSITLVNEC